MVKTWGTGKGDDFTCPECGAIYETEIHRIPQRDSDSATCEVCHKVMHSWNSTAFPIYTLKQRPS